LADVKIGEQYGFIDKMGKVVIEPEYSFADSFSEGLAAVVGDAATGKYGYIDKEGKIVIQPTFDFADKFSEGLAAVRIGDEQTGKYGYIGR